MTIARATTVPARMTSLPDAIAFVEAFCAERAVHRDDVLRLALIVEELFTNTVVHGHGGGDDAPVRIALGADAGRLELAYEDGSPPFDPIARGAMAAADLDADVEARPVGRLGLALVLSLVEDASYVREKGLNRLRLVLARTA
jgi:serine/threonine-protein kinase RsbW